MEPNYKYIPVIFLFTDCNNYKFLNTWDYPFDYFKKESEKPYTITYGLTLVIECIRI